LHVDHVLRYPKPKNLKKGDSASGGVGDVEEDDETYEKRRQMIWDYRKYRNCRPPHGVKDEIVARNEGQKKLKEKKSDLQKQIEERRQRRQQQRRQQGERMSFRKSDQITSTRMYSSKRANRMKKQYVEQYLCLKTLLADT